jgi:hypothetical protein
LSKKYPTTTQATATMCKIITTVRTTHEFKDKRTQLEVTLGLCREEIKKMQGTDTVPPAGTDLGRFNFIRQLETKVLTLLSKMIELDSNMSKFSEKFSGARAQKIANRDLKRKEVN